jgi:SAM-dependent methyltransferase
VLPFFDNSFDLVTSTNVMAAFTAALANAFIEGILFEKYGQAAVYDFFSQAVQADGAVKLRGELLDSKMADLHLKIISAHIAEVARVLRPGGIFFVSDHDMKISLLNDRGSFVEYYDNFVSAQLYFGDKCLSCARPMINFQVGRTDAFLQVEGSQSLEAILGAMPGFNRLSKTHLFNLNRSGLAGLGIEGKYFVDTVMVFTKT